MATHTLTKAAPTQEFILANDGDVQVIISDDSVFTSLAKFSLEYETDAATVFIAVPGTDTVEPYSRIYTFKAGKIQLTLEEGNDETSVTVDIK